MDFGRTKLLPLRELRSNPWKRMKVGKATRGFTPELLDYRIKRGRKTQDGFESMELSIEPLSRAEGGLQFVP